MFFAPTKVSQTDVVSLSIESNDPIQLLAQDVVKEFNLLRDAKKEKQCEVVNEDMLDNYVDMSVDMESADSDDVDDEECDSSMHIDEENNPATKARSRGRPVTKQKKYAGRKPKQYNAIDLLFLKEPIRLPKEQAFFLQSQNEILPVPLAPLEKAELSGGRVDWMSRKIIKYY